MNEDQPELNDLERRLRDARGRAKQPVGRDETPTGEVSGVSQAMRVGTELVAGLVVGAGLGWLLDGWLDTRPWLMIVFFFLGAGAGILNVYRATGQIPGPGLNTHEEANNDNKSSGLSDTDEPNP